MIYEVFVCKQREMTLDMDSRRAAVLHAIETLEGEYENCVFDQVRTDRLLRGDTAYVAYGPKGDWPGGEASMGMIAVWIEERN